MTPLFHSTPEIYALAILKRPYLRKRPILAEKWTLTYHVKEVTVSYKLKSELYVYIGQSKQKLQRVEVM